MSTLNLTMFRTTLENMMTPEQKKKWMPLVQNFRIMGAYAQTELGHGSDIAGLETTATFDQETDEFIIHTPTLKATKWWPGDLGNFSTHAVVFARLIIDGNQYGVMPFLV
jgi:acyl-CoA oxidase